MSKKRMAMVSEYEAPRHANRLDDKAEQMLSRVLDVVEICLADKVKFEFIRPKLLRAMNDYIRAVENETDAALNPGCNQTDPETAFAVGTYRALERAKRQEEEGMSRIP